MTEERKVTRRSFLNYAVTAVVAGVVAGVGSYYAGLLSAPPGVPITKTVPGPERTTTVTTTTTAAPGVPVTTTVTAPPVTKTTTVTTTAPLPIDREKLIEAAKKEGALVIYEHAPSFAIKKVIEAFTKKYPFIKLDHIRLTSGRVLAKFEAETNAGQYLVDVVGVSEPAIFIYLKKKGWLQPYITPESKALLRVGDPEGYWSGPYMGYIIGTTYNTKYVSEEESPKTWKELLNPKWTGKIGIVDPRTGGGWYPLFYLQNQKLGVEWFKNLAKIEPRIYQSGFPLGTDIASGELWLGYGTNDITYINAILKGASVRYNILDWTLNTEWGDGISKYAPHPNAAKLWIDFYHSKEGAEIMSKQGFLSFRTDAILPPGLPTIVSPKISSLKDIMERTVPVDWQLLADPKLRDEMGKIFEEIFV